MTDTVFADFTTSDGTRRLRMFPVRDGDENDVFAWFDEGRYQNAEIHQLWTGEEFLQVINNYMQAQDSVQDLSKCFPALNPPLPTRSFNMGVRP